MVCNRFPWTPPALALKFLRHYVIIEMEEEANEGDKSPLFFIARIISESDTA